MNWAGDEPVSVQEWSAYFGELLGVGRAVVVTPVPGASVGSVGDHTKRMSITGPARSTGATASVAWPSTSTPTASATPHERGQGGIPGCRRAISEAMDAAGCSDFGPGDFHEGFAVLLDSLERDADLSPATDPLVIGDFRRRLVNRLEVEAWYARASRGRGRSTLQGPVDINGLPSTGTTALATCSLSIRSSARLRLWEQRSRARRRHRRRSRRSRRLQLTEENEEVSPRTKAMHLYEIDATMEDTDARYGVPRAAVHPARYGYHAWWRDADPTEVRLPPPGGKSYWGPTAHRICGCSRRRTTSSTWRRSCPPTPSALPDDPPGPREVGAVLHELGVLHLSHPPPLSSTSAGSAGRSPSICVSAWRTPSRNGPVSARTVSSTSTIGS